jgi:phosphate starvation-inducible membrane PsiE
VVGILELLELKTLAKIERAWWNLTKEIIKRFQHHLLESLISKFIFFSFIAAIKRIPPKTPKNKQKKTKTKEDL